MNESTITVQGYVGSAPVLRQPGGHYVANFRLACTPRRFDRKEQKWVDTATSWYTVSAWRRLGQNVASSVKQGDPVVVTGQLVLREWTSSSGEPRQSYEIEASSIGHDLSRTMTSVVRMPSQIEVTTISAEVAQEPIDEEEGNLRAAQAEWGGLGLAEPQEALAA